MQWRWRVCLAVIGAALCWLSAAFVALPRLVAPVSFNQVPSTTAPTAAEAGNQAPLRNFRGNVYHIVFDPYQSEAYPYFLDKTPELNQLPFTYFPNFRTNSPRTYLSMAELFAGDLYSADLSPESWHNAALQNGMMDYLANSGVRLNLYPHYPEYCYRGALTCKTALNLQRELLGDDRARQTAVDLWFLKLIPDSLKRELKARFGPPDEDTSKGDSFSNWDYGFSISTALSPSNLPGSPDEPYFAVQQFMRLLTDEDSRPATGQYVFVHMMLPHPPLVLDGECNYVGRRPAQALAVQEQYLQQVQCAHKLTTLLVKKLESLGRLDNSLIVVHGDHGNYWQPADLGVLYKYHPLDVSVLRADDDKADSSTWPSEMIEVRASALLLIKFPGQSAASRSNKPAQTIDIAPTILRYFDIDPGAMRGMSIQDMPESPARDPVFSASTFLPQVSSAQKVSRYRYVDGRWRFEEDIRILADADQLFTIGSR